MQVVQQADLLEEEYRSSPPTRRIFAVSAQHYSFVVQAFVDLIREYGRDRYEFTLRETKTADIIEDVRTRISELGVLYLSSFNRKVLLHMFSNAEIEFHPLFTASAHVFAGRCLLSANGIWNFSKITAHLNCLSAQMEIFPTVTLNKPAELPLMKMRSGSIS